MIKANELRIGNWMLPSWDKKPIQVSPKIILEQHQSDIAEKEYLKPIEITNEWLLKFGFFKHDEITAFENIRMRYWGKDAVLLFFNHPNNTNSFLGGFGFISGHNDNDKILYHAATFKWIKYVHQLQNLYFALTGKELEIINK